MAFSCFGFRRLRVRRIGASVRFRFKRDQANAFIIKECKWREPQEVEK